MNIISRLEYFTGTHPAKPAFIFLPSQDNRWEAVSYQQLANSIQDFASGLRNCGVTPGMSAALLTPPSVDFFALAFALLKMGVIPIILDPAIGLKKVGECLAEANPDIFIGNGLTHFLRKLLGWGRNSIKYNLTIKSVKGQRAKGEALTSDHFSQI
jgi:acyl-CoA synthetase (AMP-forming)/AMP-acid ligase II